MGASTKPGAIHSDGQETQLTQPFYGLLGVDVADGGNRVIPDFPLTFTADGPAAFAAPPSTSPVYEHPFPAPLTVEAIQANDHPASGEPVTYTVHGPAVFVVSHIGTDTLQVVTGADGQAAAALYPKYNQTGPVTVTASSPDFGSVTFTETVASP